MGKFLRPVTCDQLDGLAGRFAKVIDFYYWKGIPCFRRWPHGAETVRSVSRQSSAQAFAEVARRKSRVPDLLREQFRLLAGSSTDTWGDVFTRWQMSYYSEKKELPPEIIEFSIVTGSGIRELIVKLAFGTGPVGNFYLGRLNWLDNPNGHKTYRGREIKCTPKKLVMPWPRRGLTVKSRGLSGFQRVYGDGKSKGIAFGGDLMPDPFYQNKCLIYYGPQDEYYSPLPWAMSSNRYDHSVGGLLYQNRARIQSHRARHWFNPVLPHGWDIEDVNGMRWYYKTNSTFFNRERPVRFESPNGMKIIKTFPGLDRSITVPFFPHNLDEVRCYAIPLDYCLPAMWDECVSDLEWISDNPYTQFLQCKLSKGYRNEFSYEFKTPVVGNFALTYVPLTGGEFLMGPILANPRVQVTEMTDEYEEYVDAPESAFDAMWNRFLDWIWDPAVDPYNINAYNPKLEYTPENFPELFNQQPQTDPNWQGEQPPEGWEGYPPEG